MNIQDSINRQTEILCELNKHIEAWEALKEEAKTATTIRKLEIFTQLVEMDIERQRLLQEVRECEADLDSEILKVSVSSLYGKTAMSQANDEYEVET